MSREGAGTDRAAEVMAAWRRELPGVLGPASEISKRVLFLAAELEAATRSVLPRFGLTVAEFDVLAALRRAGEPYRLKSNELSRTLMLSSGGTTNVVNRLVAAGLAVRESDAEDGRGTLVRLTGEGVRQAEAALYANTTAHEAVFAGVPDAELDAATRGLRALAPHLGSAAGARSAPATR